ncbi:hypothetical protein Dsin_000887 [Dipteronia sinensis]|uniref:Transposase MuDR plant domain-containing protein n=1 Tax=Dipteronia sinensis TaxID=43782 RepID=A0AAE0B3B4_9ROSI|nr:hypothetical protein Dsin_000887 [Dipteronia sinensis]
MRDSDSLRNLEIPREECGFGSEIDYEEDNLRSLDESDGNEVEGGQPRKFTKIKYQEFDPVSDMENPIFTIRMKFGSAYVFRKAIRVNAVKHMRDIKFQKNYANKVKAVCKDQGYNWFVFISWLGDYKNFKIMSLLDVHTCAMSFKNMFVNSKMIAEKYLEVRRINLGSSMIMKCSSEDGDENPKF